MIRKSLSCEKTHLFRITLRLNLSLYKKKNAGKNSKLISVWIKIPKFKLELLFLSSYISNDILEIRMKLLWKCLYFTIAPVSKVGQIVFVGVKNSEAVLLSVVLLAGFVPAIYWKIKIGTKDWRKTAYT